MQYGELLKKSLKTVWSHKAIWLFGIFLSFFAGPSFNLNGTTGYSPGGPSGRGDAQIKEFARSIQQADTWIHTHNVIPYVIAALVLFAIYIIAGFFLTPLFTGSLIGLAERVSQGGKAKVREGFSIGARKMFPILGEILLVGIPTALVMSALVGLDVLLFILGLSHKSGSSVVFLVLAIILTFLLVLLFIVAAVFVDLINTLSHRFIVIENEKVILSIKRAAAMLKTNFGQVLLTGLILFGLGIVAGTILGILFAIVFIPVIAIGILHFVAALVVGVLMLLLLIIPAGFIKAFQSTYWTYAFIDLRKNHN